MSTKDTGVWVCVGQEVPGTAYEQIYFGRILSEHLENSISNTGIVILFECQLCVAVAPSIRSWFELATKGPNEACRVSSPVKAASIGRVREIIECTEQAVQAWHTCPWGKVPLQQQPIQMAS